jgi:hypothetical protein
VKRGEACNVLCLNKLPGHGRQNVEVIEIAREYVSFSADPRQTSQAIDIARDISILEARAHDAEGDQR